MTGEEGAPATTTPEVEASGADENPLRTITIEKVVVNIGVGEAGERLIKAAQVLEMLTGRQTIQTLSKTTNKDLGIRKGMPIGVKLTLRRELAEEFFKKAMWVRENRIANYSFDHEGNLSFGIADYTDFPNMRYDPEIGIFGLSISVAFSRKAKRVQLRRHARRRIPKRHRTTPEEIKGLLEKKYDIEVVD